MSLRCTADGTLEVTLRRIAYPWCAKGDSLVVATVANGRDLAEAALRLKPELIILDITMPLLSGIKAAREIRKSLPQWRATVRLWMAHLKLQVFVGETLLRTGNRCFVILDNSGLAGMVTPP